MLDFCYIGFNYVLPIILCHEEHLFQIFICNVMAINLDPQYFLLQSPCL